MRPLRGAAVSGLQGAVWRPEGKNEGESLAGSIPAAANTCPSPVTGLGSRTVEARPGMELSILAWRPALLVRDAAVIGTILDLALVASRAQGHTLGSFSGSLHQLASSRCQRNGVTSESPGLAATAQKSLTTQPSSSKGGGLSPRLRHAAF